MNAEAICAIEILRNSNGTYLARVESGLGGSRELTGEDIEILLDKIFEEIQDEIETSNL